MNLYILSQNTNTDYFEAYDYLLVSAPTDYDARKFNPCEFVTHVTDNKWMGTDSNSREYEMEESDHGWCNYVDIDKVEVKCIGTYNKDTSEIVMVCRKGTINFK